MLLSVAGIPQTSVQSLLDKLKNAGDKDKFNIDLELARYYSEASPAQALTYARAAMDLSRRLNLMESETAEMNSTAGAVYYYLEDYNKSATYYEKGPGLSCEEKRTQKSYGISL